MTGALPLDDNNQGTFIAITGALPLDDNNQGTFIAITGALPFGVILRPFFVILSGAKDLSPGGCSLRERSFGLCPQDDNNRRTFIAITGALPSG
jgi:hypothetical protein